MSGKAPSFQFYPGDWTRDLDDFDLEIEGAWIRLCCRLWWSPERGKMTKTLKEYAKILRKSEKKTMVILNFLLTKGISSGIILDNQNITIISRRMVKDNELSIIRQRVGKLGGNPGLKKIQDNLFNQTPNQNATKSASLHLQSSSSSSSSSSKKKILRSVSYTEDFLKFYEIYPNKIGKREAFDSWVALNPDDELVTKIVAAVSKQVESGMLNSKELKYCKNPTTWLNKHCWDDDIVVIKGKLTEYEERVAQAKKVQQDGLPFPVDEYVELDKD